jgi:rhodanese-related sulfurtransferase
MKDRGAKTGDWREKESAVGNPTHRTRSMGQLLREAVVVLVACLALALLANALSPQGLDLSRNYFPNGIIISGALPLNEVAEPLSPNATAMPASTDGLSVVETRLRKRGLEGIELSELQAWIADPRYEMELVILVDARAARPYQEGHLPGAYSFDHYRPEATLAELLPVALMAEQVIVYCSGGDCEDSEFAAIFLRDAGVPGDRLRVYTGGLQEWREAGLSVELGQRGSGMLE